MNKEEVLKVFNEIMNMDIKKEYTQEKMNEIYRELEPTFTEIEKDIVKIMDAYEDEFGKSLEKAIKNDFSGKAEDRLLDVLNDAEKEAEDKVFETGE